MRFPIPNSCNDSILVQLQNLFVSHALSTALPQYRTPLGLILLVLIIALPGSSSGQSSTESLEEINERIESLKAATPNEHTPDLLTKEYSDRGMRYLKQKKPALALSDFTNAIDIYVGSKSTSWYVKLAIIAAYYERGLIHYSDGKADQAIADLSKAIELEPDHVDAFASRGLVYFSQKKYDLALNDLNKCISRQPKAPNCLANRGRVYLFGKSDFEKALADFSKVIELRPNDLNALMWLGLTYVRMGKGELAIEDLSRAIAQKGDHPPLFELRGQAFVMTGKYVEGEADLSKTIALGDDKVSDVYLYRGKANFRLNKFAAALADFDKAIELGQRPEAVAVEKARIYFVQDKLALALAEIDKAMKAEPSADKFELRATIYCATGKKLLAQADEKKASVLGATVSQPCK